MRVQAYGHHNVMVRIYEHHNVVSFSQVSGDCGVFRSKSLEN